MAMLTVLVLTLFLTPIQERFHWLLLVGITLGVTCYDAKYGSSMNFPLAMDEDVTSPLQYAPHFTYFLL